MSSTASSKNSRAEGAASGAEDGPQSKGSSLPLPVILVSAWLVPGTGHLLQRRWGRAITFFSLVAFSAVFGAALDGKLFTLEAGRPLATLGTLASLGSGLFHIALRWGLDYQGDIRSITYEYGGAFLLTAGLMNLLAMLDAWDVATGRKP